MKFLSWKRLCALVCLGWTLVFPLAAEAGRNCDDKPADAGRTQRSLRFAAQVRETLDLSGARLVLIGRVGSDQSKRGIRYTHVGYAFREQALDAWTVVHQLNSCGSGSSDLYDEGLGSFFMDDPFDYETKIVIPSPGLQDKLVSVLLGPLKRGLHETTYSSIANPWSTRYQNSNGWALEILAAAGGPEAINRRADAQRWLKAHDYRPHRIAIGAGERAGARLFTPNIRFGDHPDSAWQTQTYEISTGDSAIDFLRQVDAGSRLVTQALDRRAVLAPTAVAAAPTIIASQRAPAAPAVAAATPAPSPARAATSSDRAQLLQSMQGLITAFACRPQGYLNACRQLAGPACERQVGDAVLRCFATVSDQQLMSGSEQMAMQQMQDVGYCAVEGVDAGLAAAGTPARDRNGQACPSVRNFR